jgi:Flp pilus assembly pilin Flp
MLNPETQSKVPSVPTRASLAGDEKGGTAIEYALIAAGIGVAVAATVYGLGTATAGLYQAIASLF